MHAVRRAVPTGCECSKVETGAWRIGVHTGIFNIVFSFAGRTDRRRGIFLLFLS